jgi:hypothetical protein
MGGYGSGRWKGHRKKTTVEESLYITAHGLKEAFDHGPGSMALGSWPGASVSFRVEDEEGGRGRSLHVTYTREKEARSVDYNVRVVKTSPHFGGARWYFICPLEVNGSPCLRRVSKLYLPPGALYFGCRECYGLTYTTSQESHKFDALYKALAAEVGRGMTPADVKKLLTAREGKT